jgi:hypothetical protein
MGETVMKRFLVTAAMLGLGVIVYIPKSNANPLVNTNEIKLVKDSNLNSTKTASSWQEFTPDGFNISVLFPDENDSTTSKSGNEGFLLNLRATILRESGYIFGYGKFKVDISQLEPNILLDSYISGRAAKDVELVDKKEIKLEKYLGKEYQLRYKDGIISKGRIYLVGQNMYAFEVVNPQNPEAETFFNSIKLVK